ncbi:uncharacterized protein [Penaeus vannamei]|uniref:uncharacterized protein n=1 Tax=Penaeus vannamei TaxID=6689 RepID=UPI00387F6C54
MLMEKYREGQEFLERGVEALYEEVRSSRELCEGDKEHFEKSETVMRCAAGMTKGFNVKVDLPLASTLSPFLFAMVMNRLADEIRWENPWTMMFAEDIGAGKMEICTGEKENESKQEQDRSSKSPLAAGRNGSPHTSRFLGRFVDAGASENSLGLPRSSLWSPSSPIRE